MKERVSEPKVLQKVVSSTSRLDEGSSYYSDDSEYDAENDNDSFNSEVSLEKQKSALKKAMRQPKQPQEDQVFFGQAIQDVHISPIYNNHTTLQIPEITPSRSKRQVNMVEEVVRPPPASQLQNINNSQIMNPQTESSSEEDSSDSDSDDNDGKRSHEDSSYDSEEVERTQRGTSKKPLQQKQLLRLPSKVPDSGEEISFSDSDDSEESGDSQSLDVDEQIAKDLEKNTKKEEKKARIELMNANIDPEQLKDIVRVRQESNQLVCFCHLFFKILGVFS